MLSKHGYFRKIIFINCQIFSDDHLQGIDIGIELPADKSVVFRNIIYYVLIKDIKSIIKNESEMTLKEILS
jgi:hypothetical protein